MFDYYNDLLGKPFARQHRIDLTQLSLPRLDLDELAAPFMADEVTRIVRETPSDRAPGPDGFSGAFFKVAWGVVGTDVVRVFQAFWDLDCRSLNLINEAMMVLLHKTATPDGLRDYRPISLIHSVGKLVAKGLALRLAPFMHRLVRGNQSAFIRGRSIHENFRAVQLTCRWLHAQNHPTVLLKVDLAKAFDTVAWPFLLEVLEHVGFPSRWHDWLSALLATASTKVLVNGRPGRRICHARGLRQGDPLSPLLFVIVMDVLNALISEADRRGELTPLPGNTIKHRASIYADDLVIFLAPTANDFLCIRQLLELFAGASGLSTNLDRCTVSPIRCSDDMVQEVLAVFPCRVQPFPTVYLGAPLSLSRLERAQEQTLDDKVAARIPTWKAGLLTNIGRATLTRSTLFISPSAAPSPPRQSKTSTSVGARSCRLARSLSRAVSARLPGRLSAPQKTSAGSACPISECSASPYACAGSGCAGLAQTLSGRRCRCGLSRTSPACSARGWLSALATVHRRGFGRIPGCRAGQSPSRPQTSSAQWPPVAVGPPCGTPSTATDGRGTSRERRRPRCSAST